MTNSSNAAPMTEQEAVSIRSEFHWAQPPSVLLQRMEQRLGQILLGKQATIREVMVGLLAGGHLLIEDVPGVGKTMLATAIARLLGGKFHRIQFTSDLMPADIVGGMVVDASGRGLVYREGPIMANVVLADELNRASTRTQSALLEALEHRSVSIEGTTYALPQPFVFIATQNPIRYEGTNRLLEAQLDRFMMQLSIGYPSQQSEQELLGQFAASRRPQPELLRALISHEEWQQMQAELQQVYIHPSLLAYMTEVAAETRNNEELLLGLSPRALRDWLRAAQASAYMQDRGFIVPDDLLQLGVTVLAHRIELRGYPTAHAQKQDMMMRLLQHIPISSHLKGRVR
ncbi:AAA family ATPase [Paenibacillus sp. FSL W7-1287]|uniref:AAA family ATPase n=1 Tax=Paenibacillus sp. FSL W7-1287 TaxID=2954538 RepID=UPI0030FBBE15